MPMPAPCWLATHIVKSAFAYSWQRTELQDTSGEQKGSLAPKTRLATLFQYQVVRISSETYTPHYQHWHCSQETTGRWRPIGHLELAPLRQNADWVTGQVLGVVLKAKQRYYSWNTSCNEGIWAMTKQHRNEPYQGYYLDFALYGIDIENAEKKLDAAVRCCNYIADLIAVCSVQTYYLIVTDFLKVSRHL